MDASEIETYRYQLAQVQASLAADSSNVALAKLRDDLTALLALSESLGGASSSSASASAPAQPLPPPAAADAPPAPVPVPITQPSSHPSALTRLGHHRAGDLVIARYAADGRWYPAKVVSVGGSDVDRVYGVVFKGYVDVEIVRQTDTRKKGTGGEKRREGGANVDDYDRSTAPPTSRPASTAAAPSDASATAANNPRKRKPKRIAEETTKQRAWLEFAKSSTSARTNKASERIAPALNKKSIFATTETGRVGVVGSGKPMTEQATTRQRHIFGSEEAHDGDE